MPSGDDRSVPASVMNGAGDTSASKLPEYQPVDPPGIARGTRPPSAVTVNRRPATSADADASTIVSLGPAGDTEYSSVTPGKIPGYDTVLPDTRGATRRPPGSPVASHPLPGSSNHTRSAGSALKNDPNTFAVSWNEKPARTDRTTRVLIGSHRPARSR